MNSEIIKATFRSNDNTWINLNELINVPVGTAIKIQNVGTLWFHITETDKDLSVAPEDSDETPEEVGYLHVTNLNYPYASAEITSGSKTIWVKGSRISEVCSAAIQIL
ncbi:MAG: hypothetical protein CME61_09485 [Halobacteriovoraceae bacterium]|nr:hypothetical protein [Halobacteriovoraceae bacterium]